MVTHGLSPSGSSYHLLGGTGRGCTMTQTHPTSEVAALVPTGGEKSLCCPLLLPHPPLGKFLSRTCSHPPRREFLSFSGFNHASEISRGWTVGGSSKRAGGSSGELQKTQELLNLPGKERSRWGSGWAGGVSVRLTKRRMRSHPRLPALQESRIIPSRVVFLLMLQ